MLYEIYSYSYRFIFVGLILTIGFDIDVGGQVAGPASLAEKTVRENGKTFKGIERTKSASKAVLMAGNNAAANLSIAQKAIVLNNLGVKHAANMEWESALLSLQKAIAADPAPPEPYLNLSIVLEKLNRIEESITAAKKGVAIAPKFIRGWDQLCELYMMSKSFAPAAECYESYEKLKPKDDTFYLKYGVALMNIAEQDRALLVLEKAVALLPDNPAGWNAVGLIYFKKKKFKESAKMFQRAVDIHPDEGRFRLNLGIALLANRNRASALSQYKLLKESDPELARKLYRELYKGQVVYVGGRK